MSILNDGDQVRIKPFAYNIADHRVGRLAVVTRIDSLSRLLPVRIEYQDGNFNWTNYESLELVKAASAPSQHAELGAEILNKMVELKASIVHRDNAVKLVVEQTEALDLLLASVGLKRVEAVIGFEAVAKPTFTTAYVDWSEETITVGAQYKCTSKSLEFYTKDKVYTVVDIDYDDDAPVAFRDDDDDQQYPKVDELLYFIRVL